MLFNMKPPRNDAAQQVNRLDVVSLLNAESGLSAERPERSQPALLFDRSGLSPHAFLDARASLCGPSSLKQRIAKGSQDFAV